MDSKETKPIDIEEITTEENAKVEVYAEKAEPEVESYDEESIRLAAAAYAKYLSEHNLEPGEATFVEPEELGVELKPEEGKAEEPIDEKVEEKAETPVEKKKVKIKKSDLKSGKKKNKKKPDKTKKPDKAEKSEKPASIEKKDSGESGLVRALAAPITLHDKIQHKLDRVVTTGGRNLIAGIHRQLSSYRNSRRMFARVMIILLLMTAAIALMLDKNSAYEYAYNGKVLGYVNDQEEVTDVLDIAGEKLSSLNGNGGEVKFTANDNVTFKLVDATGKTTDDADTAVSKLTYMTDIEAEAYGVYDGNKLITIVESSEAAERLLDRSLSALSEPDSGMELVSADFTNELEIKPINVLLGSIQGSESALQQMTEGGDVNYYHIVEEGETITTIAETFGVDTANIYDSTNSEIVQEVEQGDKICVRNHADAVSVEMVETGKLKETIEYETIKEESDDYYQGDTHVEQEGVDGVQIFEGTITKVAGEVTDRQTESVEVITEKQDKIILVGTAERPKTAATGTFALPIDNPLVTSEFGARWGRMHEGMDFGASTGTPIYASDGGTVTRAGWFSGYGLCVDIDHENGYTTRYGHCSQVLVSVGDKVYQGREIALVGNTGNSTGSHLHFEVHDNGTAMNPRGYIDL